MLPPSKSSITVPKGACDCHVHVFGPYDTYPLSAGRSYTPPVALIDDLFARMDTAGIDRAVIVQPSAYGTDNRVTLNAVRAHPDRLRAVAVIDGSESDAALEAMHMAGTRGVRLNIISGAGRTMPASVWWCAASPSVSRRCAGTSRFSLRWR